MDPIKDELPAGATAPASGITQAQLDQAKAEAATAERTRIAAITGSAEAKGREGLASHFAHHTDMPADAAIAALGAAPMAATLESTTPADPLGAAMAGTEQPEVTAEHGDDAQKALSGAAKMAAAFDQHTGKGRK